CLYLTYLFLPLFGGLLTAGILHVRKCCRCYMVALSEDKKFSTLAPLRGFAFIAAWATLLF
ncbi:unnamed protein product, partial [Brassica rapa subsp. narinosa]